jgi:hypothetical protein
MFRVISYNPATERVVIQYRASAMTILHLSESRWDEIWQARTVREIERIIERVTGRKM